MTALHLMLGKLVCHFRGHIWRRLRKNERWTGFVGVQPETAMVSQLRICDRCGAAKAVKARKGKA